MTGIIQGLLASIGSAVASAASDAYFNLVTLLLNTSSTNGAQNNTFLDSSTNNFTITRNGNTTQGTFTPFSQTGWGNYFGGSDYLSFTSSANFAFGTGDYTVETWVYLTSTSTYQTLFGSVTTDALMFNIYSMNQVVIQTAGSNIFATFSGATFATNTWYHVAVSRSSGTVKAFVNGVQYGSTITSNTTNYAQPSTNTIGANGASQYFSGYLSNLRVNKGTAVYTSAFTPSTTPLTAISGTQLLTCQDNRFKDNSTNAIALTVNGTPSVQAFSPFAPTAAYDTAVVGGSGYFDGSGDYLTTGSSANLAIGTNDFCIEWFYYPNTSSDATPFCQWGGGANDWILQFNSGNFIFYYASTSISYTYTPIPNQWIHACVCRSGSTMSLYLNGTRVNTKTDTTSIPNTRGIVVGVNPDGAGQNCNGYIAYPRLVVGNSVYTPSSTTLTVPTAPLTAVTGTKFLVGMTNAGIFDSASKNVLETVGNAQASTTQAKWGTTSIYFDGTGDYLAIPSGYNLGFGTGDFTIEGWLYLSATSSYSTIMSNRPNGSDTTTGRWSVAVRSSAFEFYANGSQIISAGTVSTSTWTHFAVTRASGSLRLFLGGTQVGSTTSFTTDLSSLATWVGANGAGTEAINAYIDDLRVTKGYARYTSNFTPATAAFPLQ